jgi:transcriptional regulator GlxA family with amidase domain
MASLDIGILLYEGFDEVSALLPHAVLEAAADCDIEATTYSLVPTETMPAASGLGVAPDDVLIGTPDLVLVPGGPWADRSRPGAGAVAEAGEYPDRLATLVEGGAAVAAASTGVLLLGEAGLLDGRQVACHDNHRDAAADYGAEVLDADVVVDGEVITAAGAIAAADLGLFLVERECGAGAADAVAAAFGHERSADVVVRDAE